MTRHGFALCLVALLTAGCQKPHSPPPTPSIAEPQPADDSGPLSGIGIRPLLAAGGFAVGQVFPGSNAERAGLRVGDVVVEIDGQPTAHYTLDDVADRLRGRPGSAVTLDVERGAAHLHLTITRALLHVPPLPQ